MTDEILVDLGIKENETIFDFMLRNTQEQKRRKKWVHVFSTAFCKANNNSIGVRWTGNKLEFWLTTGRKNKPADITVHIPDEECTLNWQWIEDNNLFDWYTDEALLSNGIERGK